MPTKIINNDLELMALLGKFKILTVNQLSILSQRSRQVIRRRLRFLTDQGLIATRERPYGNGRGRPEILIFLTKSGQVLLHENDHSFSRNLLEKDNPLDSICIEHDLLTNWIFIHLIQIEREISPLSVDIIPLYSGQIDHYDRKDVHVQIRIPTGNPDVEFSEFIPDGVFNITNFDLEKILLFFLEVDMGTETIASPKRDHNDVRQKIINYQTYFRTGQYKRYEKIFGSRFNGFRLLFLTNSFSRFKALCRLVREMPPNDFLWLTDQEQMFASGLSAKIWARGGRDNNPLQSILGPKMACQVTVMDKIK